MMKKNHRHGGGADKKEANFEPRQSTRISTKVEADNDQWTEYITIIDLLNPRTNAYELQTRSFFESASTRRKVWDEPPSGAKNVVWASEEAKNKAKEQMKDLGDVGTMSQDWTSDVMGVMNDVNFIDNKNGNKVKSSSKKKKFSWIRKRNPFRGVNHKKEAMNLPQNLAYQRGSRTEEFHLDQKDGLQTNQLNLQRALASSLNTGADNAGTLDGVYYTSENASNIYDHLGNINTQDMDAEEALALAKALSLSESEFKFQQAQEANFYAPREAYQDRKMSPEEWLRANHADNNR